MGRSRAPQGPGPEVGQALGPYRLEEVLGKGGMGIVFRAVRETDGEVVALKVLRPELAADAVYRQRFAREARVAAEVQDRHLVPIVEAGEADGQPYLAARHVHGRTLAQRVEAEGQLPLEDVVRVAAEVGAGLDALHRHGLIHRDVKPSNVMLREDGAALLGDFWLAKGWAYTVLTRPGQVMGTLDYIAPELIRGGEASPASDIYALGCLVYEGLAGRPPFAGVSPFQVGIAHLEAAPPDPAAGREDLPPRLSWAVLQALEKDPARRPQTATAYAYLIRLAAKARSAG